MAHADSFKSTINRFSPSILRRVKVHEQPRTPFVIAVEQSDALDQWTAIHLLQEIALFDSAICSSVTVWKELQSAWKQFFAHIHFDCTGDGSTTKKSFSVQIAPINSGAGQLFDLTMVDWATPKVGAKYRGHITPFTRNQGDDRITVTEVQPPSTPRESGGGYYYEDESVET